MDTRTYEELYRFYSNLRNALTIKERTRENSVLLSMLNVKSNKAYKLLGESSVTSVSISRAIFDSLISNGFIRMAEKPGKYAITIKGVWEIESKSGIMNPEILLEYLDRKFFDLFTESGQLGEREKAILVTMIAARCFSPESALDLKKNKTDLTRLQGLLESSYDFLLKHGQIAKLKRSDLFGAQGNEHPVSNLIRHTDALFKKTRGLYKTLGKQQYYLDLGEPSAISEEGLITLLGYIFGSSMTPETKYEFNDFCLKNAYEESPYLFDLSAHRFANPIYDRQFNEALEKYFASKHRWDSEK